MRREARAVSGTQSRRQECYVALNPQKEEQASAPFTEFG